MLRIPMYRKTSVFLYIFFFFRLRAKHIRSVLQMFLYAWHPGGWPQGQFHTPSEPICRGNQMYGGGGKRGCQACIWLSVSYIVDKRVLSTDCCLLGETLTVLQDSPVPTITFTFNFRPGGGDTACCYFLWGDLSALTSFFFLTLRFYLRSNNNRTINFHLVSRLSECRKIIIFLVNKQK